MKYRDLYASGAKALECSGIAEALIDARLLLEYVCHTDRNYLYAHPEEEVSQIQEEMYDMLIKKRALRIPLQHITGVQEFMGLEFKVNSDVLIPRQDTETLVEEAMMVCEDGSDLLDLCTGSGCVLISVAKYKNDIKATGVDISKEALSVASQNAEKLLGNEGWEFVESDLFENVKGRFDIITANPPYIKTDVIKGLEPEVKDYDPMLALDGGADGLDIVEKIISKAHEYLKSEGWLMLEIGHDQGEEVKSLFVKCGYSDVEIVKDYCGNDRVVKGRYFNV